MEAKGSGIERISSKDYETLKDNFSSVQGRENELSSDLVERMRMAAAFISQYTAQDILASFCDKFHFITSPTFSE
jgi:hypothetical protein